MTHASNYRSGAAPIATVQKRTARGTTAHQHSHRQRGKQAHLSVAVLMTDVVYELRTMPERFGSIEKIMNDQRSNKYCNSMNRFVDKAKIVSRSSLTAVGTIANHCNIPHRPIIVNPLPTNFKTGQDGIGVLGEMRPDARPSGPPSPDAWCGHTAKNRPEGGRSLSTGSIGTAFP